MFIVLTRAVAVSALTLLQTYNQQAQLTAIKAKSDMQTR